MTTKCIVNACDRPVAQALRRGLCMECYGKAKGMVSTGATTWSELVELGLALPDKDPLTEAFNEAKAKEKK